MWKDLLVKKQTEQKGFSVKGRSSQQYGLLMRCEKIRNELQGARGSILYRYLKIPRDEIQVSYTSSSCILVPMSLFLPFFLSFRLGRNQGFYPSPEE